MPFIYIYKLQLNYHSPNDLYTMLCFRALSFLYFFFQILLASFSALAKTYSFAILGLSVGLCELQMCMALCVGFFKFLFSFFNCFIQFFFYLTFPNNNHIPSHFFQLFLMLLISFYVFN